MPTANDQQERDTGPAAWLERLAAVLGSAPRDRHALVKLLRDAEVRKLVDQETLVMIEGALRVAEMQVRDIMVPRIQMVTVKDSDPLDELLRKASESGHSRLPVIGDDPDTVSGILMAKDLLACQSTPEAEFDIRDVMRAPQFVPESKRLNVLLREFRNSRSHIAVVVDEYGGVAGVVTIEDIIEEIVGEIADEHDPEEQESIQQVSEGHYLIQGLTPIEDFNARFATDFDSEEHDTVGGLVLQRFGRLPKTGESIDFDGFHVQIAAADKRRIHRIELHRRGSTDAEPAASDAE